MKMRFEEEKERALKVIEEDKVTGRFDFKIAGLIDLINSNEHLFTTSSCAGRISVSEVKEPGRKIDHVFLGKWHREVRWKELWDAMERGREGVVFIKFEPFILHVRCRDVEHANKIIAACRNSGLKHSSILHLKPRILVEVEGLDFICTPVMKNGKIFIDKNYMRFLAHELNKKMKKNDERLKVFEKNLKKIIV